MDYGKLAEQYGSFLVAIGGVSITVLTLVMSIWHLRPDLATLGANEADVVNNRSALIKSLIIATFCSFVGAHLMAETAAFVSGQPKGFGARQFLVAGVNIFIAVTIVMFAIMLLTTEYKKENERLLGIRRMSKRVFGVVVVCVLCWMGVSILWRMPPKHWGWSAVLPFCLIAALFVFSNYRWRKKKDTQEWTKKKARLLASTFAFIIVTTLVSLVYFSWSLYHPHPAGEVTWYEAAGFVFTITFTCGSLLSYGLAAGGNHTKEKVTLWLWRTRFRIQKIFKHGPAHS